MSLLAHPQQAPSLPAVQGESIPVTSMRPSRMAKFLEHSFPSSGVMKADDEAGLLWVRAGKEKTAELRRYVELVDQKPVRIDVWIDVDSPIDHATASVQTRVANNHSFRFIDESVGADLAVTPRVNDDGSVTFFAETSYQGTTVSLVGRAKKGESFTFRLGPSGGIVEDTVSTNEKRLQWPKVTIRARL